MIATQIKTGEKGSGTMETPASRTVPRCTVQQLAALVMRCGSGAYEGDVTLFELGRFYRVIPKANGDRRDEVICGVCGSTVLPEKAHVLASVVTCHVDALKVLKEIKGNEEMRDARIPIPFFRPTYGAAVQRRRAFRETAMDSVKQSSLDQIGTDEEQAEARDIAHKKERMIASAHIALERHVFDFFARPLSVEEIRDYLVNARKPESKTDAGGDGFDLMTVELPSVAKKNEVKLPAGVEVHFSKRANIPEVSPDLMQQFTSDQFMNTWFLLANSQNRFRENIGIDVYRTHPDRERYVAAISDLAKKWQERFPTEYANFRRAGLIMKKRKSGETLNAEEQTFFDANPHLFEPSPESEKKPAKKVYRDFGLEEAERTEQARQRDLKIKEARAKKTEDLTPDEAKLLKDEDSRGEARKKRSQLEAARRARQLQNSAAGPDRGKGKGKKG